MWNWFRISVLMIVTATCTCGQSAPIQSSVCNPREMIAQLRPNYPTYADALELAQTLTSSGVRVKCILRSKMETFFDDVKGAALYRTDHGDFEALVLPKPQDVSDLDIVEQQQNGRFVYLLVRRNPGQSSPASMDGPRRLYFIKHGSQLLVAYDEQTAESLRAILNLQ
jgi:hypothetical protein